MGHTEEKADWEMCREFLSEDGEVAVQVFIRPAYAPRYRYRIGKMIKRENDSPFFGTFFQPWVNLNEDKTEVYIDRSFDVIQSVVEAAEDWIEEQLKKRQAEIVAEREAKAAVPVERVVTSANVRPRTGYDKRFEK